MLLGIGQQWALEVGENVGMLCRAVSRLSGILGEIVQLGLAWQERDLVSFQSPFRIAPPERPRH
ncbi:hypothetical protein C3941_21435 [Kaistia algarum]|nr:hypothetical protein C3941_21435 [Kaistia algarum]